MSRTNMRRRAFAASALAAVLLLVTACTGLQTTGQVQPGLSADDVAADPPIVYRPEAPQKGATPEQIVRGFLDAATSPARDWGTAREFLTTTATWTPSASVQIVTSERTFEFEEGAATGTVSLVPVGYLDANGAYSSQSQADALTLQFALAQQDGEWRIAKVPEGIVLEQDVFPQVYQAASLMYWDPSWTFLVPDQRWVPKVNAATWITRSLLDGPSPWLAGSVVSALPDGVSLAGDAVPVESKAATVRLSGVDLTQLDDQAVARIRAQLAASLRTSASLGVNLYFDGSPMLAAPATSTSVSVDTRALIGDEEHVGWLSGDDLSPLEPLDAVLADTDVRALSVAVASDRAAGQTADGHVFRVDGETLREIDLRPGLLAPSIDPQGYVWVVDPADPTHLVVYDSEGVETPVQADALQIASRIEAFEVSRDGTRLAAVLTVGGTHELVVLGILRAGAAGQPSGLGTLTELNQLGAMPGRASSVAWLDELTVAAAIPAESESAIVVQAIGGSTTSSSVAARIVQISGVNDPTAVRLLSDDGSLYAKRSATWNRMREDVTLLATQQGNGPDTDQSIG